MWTCLQCSGSGLHKRACLPMVGNSRFDTCCGSLRHASPNKKKFIAAELQYSRAQVHATGSQVLSARLERTRSRTAIGQWMGHLGPQIPSPHHWPGPVCAQVGEDLNKCDCLAGAISSRKVIIQVTSNCRQRRSLRTVSSRTVKSAWVRKFNDEQSAAGRKLPNVQAAWGHKFQPLQSDPLAELGCIATSHWLIACHDFSHLVEFPPARIS